MTFILFKKSSLSFFQRLSTFKKYSKHERGVYKKMKVAGCALFLQKMRSLHELSTRLTANLLLDMGIVIRS